MPVTLAIVIIGLNEAEALPRCFRSVAQAIVQTSSRLESVEVVFVDAGSQDGSRSIALAAVDKLVAFDTTATAAAARWAGARESAGAYLLFLDGDMELAPTWLSDAFSALVQHPDAAGVTGIRRDVAMAQDGHVVRENVYGAATVRPARHFGGAVMLERAAFERACGFDPTLQSAEEPDLHARLLRDGRCVLEIPVPFVTHRLKGVASRGAKIRRVLGATGLWRSLFKAIQSRYFRAFVRVHPYFIMSAAMHLLAMVALAAFGWSGPVLVESVALIVLTMRGRARELPLALLRWAALITHPRAAWRGATGMPPAYRVIAATTRTPQPMS